VLLVLLGLLVLESVGVISFILPFRLGWIQETSYVLSKHFRRAAEEKEEELLTALPVASFSSSAISSSLTSLLDER
jgi:hypothetical protein